MGLAAGCNSLIGSERRVAIDKIHATERHIEFFGDQLVLNGPETLPKIALAGIPGYSLILRNRDPGIHLVEARVAGRSRGLAPQFPRPAAHAEADDQSPSAS